MPAGYYLIGETISDVREFPIAERIESTPQGRRAGPVSIERTAIELKTEELVEWNYLQAEQRVWRLVYRIYTAAQLQFFADLDAAVHGNILSFYFCPDLSESPMQIYLVKKDRDFLPPGGNQATTEGGFIQPVRDYVLPLREQSAAAYILA